MRISAIFCVFLFDLYGSKTTLNIIEYLKLTAAYRAAVAPGKTATQFYRAISIRYAIATGLTLPQYNSATLLPI
jgi:hypothetical protein